MAKDLFLLDVPIFEVEFEKDKEYKYSTDIGTQNLNDVLNKASGGYCMYCYTKILVDNKLISHLEHSIEQVNSYILKDCHMNISITCPKCNLSYKKKDQKKRALDEEEIKVFEANCDCNHNCTTMCESYDELKDKYISKDCAQIILQPFGVINKITENRYLLQYDILNQSFIFSNKYDYNDYEKDFILKHIKRFNLNDSKCRTKEVIKVCEDVIYNKNIPRKKRYDNLIADLFIDRLNELDLDKAVKLCEHIIVISNFNHKS